MKYAWLALFYLYSPFTVVAQNTPVPDDLPDQLVPCGDGNGEPACQTCHFYQLVENIFEWVFGILLIVAGIVIVVGGARLVFSGGNHMAKRDARKIIKTALISLILVGSAWIIVDLMIATLYGVPDASGIWTSLQCVEQPIPEAR